MQPGALVALSACAALGALPPPVRAEVVGVDIETQVDAWNGAAFGDVGAYEYLTGRIRFAIDPDNPRNQIIAGLDRAGDAGAAQVEVSPKPPKVGRDGDKVAFSADFQILRPKDPAKGNGTLLLDVVNRGARTVDRFNRATPSGDAPRGDDGFLMRRGFTVLWVGWEFDLRSVSTGMRIIVPRSRGSRCTVRGAVTPSFASMTATFDDLSGYRSNDAAVNASLSVRDGVLGKPMPIEHARYTLERYNFVTLQDMFKSGRTYELSYDVVDAPLGGLGFAAVRDAVSWLRYAPDSQVNVQRTLAFGSSQSGRFLRTFLYLGFNGDEHGRRVFDGVMAHIAGASRLDLNRLCATPTSLGQFDATSFPFADEALRDPVTGIEEGALDNPRARDFKPKIFYTNTGVEYWGGARSAALIHTTPDGEHDLTLPDNERVYFLTGSQHGPKFFPPDAPNLGEQRENPNDYWLTMRALLVAMEEWLRDGKAPPSSRYPQLRDKTLVRSTDVAFPALPGVRAPQTLPVAPRAANALLAHDGAGTPLPYLVPQTDRDGIELAGVRLPDIEVPLATYTGWNYRRSESGGADQLYPLLGSYIPFASTAAAREATKDPRASIAERYASKQAYLDRVRAAGEKLVGDRYLLAEDLPAVLERAAQHWDLLTK
ncbi:MAG TPA: alpha/beta hydrolase domain-containing protein [Gammaproteobacteria bacterium]|nr:alpha/beta hydrolase domain-containing protein [Gammaproteobacteria bacterium]